MAYINKSIVRKKMLKGMTRKSADEKIYQKINAVFQRKKRKAISDFESHPVTQEIKGGADSSNISRTLGGYGNLYTFIGFDSGDPTAAVTSMLNSEIRLSRVPAKKQSGKRILYTYRIHFPTTDELGSVAPMPWEPGNWVSRIERGISGLGFYIYNNYIAASRSGRGVQAKGQVRTAMYSRTTYMSAIFATFRKGWRL